MSRRTLGSWFLTLVRGSRAVLTAVAALVVGHLYVAVAELPLDLHDWSTGCSVLVCIEVRASGQLSWGEFELPHGLDAFRSFAREEGRVLHIEVLVEEGIYLLLRGREALDAVMRVDVDLQPDWDICVKELSANLERAFSSVERSGLSLKARGLKGLRELEEQVFVEVALDLGLMRELLASHPALSRIEVLVDGETRDLALVDVVVYDDLFTGSKAIWEIGKVSQVFLNRASADSIGLSSIGGQIHCIGPEEPRGLYLELGDKGHLVVAAVAPGRIERVFVRCRRVIETGEEIEIESAPCVLGLDGERDFEVQPGRRTTLRIARDGPMVVDVSRTMRAAVQSGILSSIA